MSPQAHRIGIRHFGWMAALAGLAAWMVGRLYAEPVVERPVWSAPRVSRSALERPSASLEEWVKQYRAPIPELIVAPPPADPTTPPDLPAASLTRVDAFLADLDASEWIGPRSPGASELDTLFLPVEAEP